jgi:cell division ATPase FtsA
LTEILELVDREFKKIHRSKKLPGGVTFVGGTAKLPGLVEFTKEVLELPARVGSWKHIGKVVDGLDEHIFAPAVGLMLLDMLLGPAQTHGYTETEPGMFKSVGASVSNILGRFRKN